MHACLYAGSIKGQQLTEIDIVEQAARRTVAVAWHGPASLQNCWTVANWCWYCGTVCFLSNNVSTAGQLSAAAATMPQPKHFGT